MKIILFLCAAINCTSIMAMEKTSSEQPALIMQRATLRDWRSLYNFMIDDSVSRYAHGARFAEVEQELLKDSWKLFFGVGLALASNADTSVSSVLKQCTALSLSAITGGAHDATVLRFEKIVDSTGALRAVACIYKLNPAVRKAFALPETQTHLDRTAVVVDLITRSDPRDESKPAESDQIVTSAQQLVMQTLFADTQKKWKRIFTHKNPNTPTGAQVLRACQALGMHEIATKDYAYTTLVGSNRLFPLTLVCKERE